MKRFFCVLILGVLMLSISAITCAEGNLKVYGDFMVSGRYSYSYSGNYYYPPDSYNKGFSLFILGGQYTLEKLKIAGEMSLSGQIEDGSKVSFSEIKGGYCLLKTEKAKFDITGGYLVIDGTSAKRKYSSIIAGTDVAFVLSDTATLEGTVGIGLSNDFTDYGVVSYTKPSSLGIYEYKIKVNFIAADNIAISAGYRGYSISSTYNSTDENATLGFSGLTLGASFKL